MSQPTVLIPVELRDLAEMAWYVRQSRDERFIPAGITRLLDALEYHRDNEGRAYR